MSTLNLQYCPFCMTPLQPGAPSCPHCGRDPSSYTPDSHHLPPGTVLRDRYVLGGVLGSGGFGITYIGYDTNLELRVAIKEYFPTSMVSRDNTVTTVVHCYSGAAGQNFEHGRERFIKEARVLAKMDKTPEIVTVRDFFETNGTAYIVMEYIEGTTLKDLVAQNGGRLPAPQFLSLVKPLFGALDALHKQGLIHRDISPDNLMIENGKIRLLDFGCAREAVSGSETMTVVMKQGFSPIEQYQRKGQGPWTDVYALAATIYYCVTGQTPAQPLDRIAGGRLVPPRELGADLTEQQENAILRSLSLQPPDRPQSMGDFYNALYMEQTPPPDPLTPPEPPSPPKPPKPSGGKPSGGSPSDDKKKRLIPVAAGIIAAIVLAVILAICFNSCSNPGTAESNSLPPAVTPSAEPTSAVADPEAIPAKPLYFNSFEDAAGLNAVHQAPLDEDPTLTGATYALSPSVHEIMISDGYGVVGNSLILDGKYGVSIPDFPKTADDTYTIAFWYAADRYANMNPILEMGRNVGMYDLADAPPSRAWRVRDASRDTLFLPKGFRTTIFQAHPCLF